MQVNLFFVVFNLNCGLHAVSVENCLQGCQIFRWFRFFYPNPNKILVFRTPLLKISNLLISWVLAKVEMLMVLISTEETETPAPQLGNQEVDDVRVRIQIKTLILWMTWFWARKVHQLSPKCIKPHVKLQGRPAISDIPVLKIISVLLF